MIGLPTKRRFFSSIYTRALAVCLVILFTGATLRTYFIQQGLSEEVQPLVMAAQQAQAERLAAGIGRDLALRRTMLLGLAADLPVAAPGEVELLQAWLGQHQQALNGLFTGMSLQDGNGNVLASTRPGGDAMPHARAGLAPYTVMAQPKEGSVVILSVPLTIKGGAATFYLRGSVALDVGGALAVLAHMPSVPTARYALIFPSEGAYLPLALPIGKLRQGRAMEAGADAQRVVKAYVGEADWIVQAVVSPEQMRAPVTRIKGFMVRSTWLHLAVLIVVVVGMVSWFIWPLKQAAVQAQRMARGELPLTPLAIVARDEVGELMLAFNLLLQRLEQQSVELTVQMRRAETAAHARTRFLAAASHDMRQPMHALNLYLGALARVDLPPDAMAVLTSASQCARTMDDMFRALLDISRLDASAMQVKPSRFPIALVLEKISTEFSQQAAEKGLRLRVVRSAAIVESDIELVERVLRNLVSNALRYTPRGKVLVGCRRVGARLMVCVYDTGIGIAPQEQQAIFEEFYQVGNPARDRAQGLGLGLALVQRLAGLLGASLTLRSVPELGSLFAFDLPIVAAAPMLQAPVGGGAQTTSRGGSLVAVIDDEAVVLDATTLLLTRAGYRVAAASSGAEILTALAASDSVPAAIICDYRLRGDETGSDVVQALREEFNYDIPAMLITGDTSPVRIQALLATGIPLLHKPLQDSVLLEALANLLQSGGSAD